MKDKERKRIEERIDFLQNELNNALKKKTHNSKEISVADYHRKISDLRKQLTV